MNLRQRVRATEKAVFESEYTPIIGAYRCMQDEHEMSELKKWATAGYHAIVSAAPSLYVVCCTIELAADTMTKLV